MTAATRQVPRPWLIRLTPQMVILFIIAAAAAAWTVRRADGMWDVPGTMGYSLPGFIGMWVMMMAAMMLPSVAPFASMYARTVRTRRVMRLALFASGYLVAWGLLALPAYGLAWLAGEYSGGTAGTVAAAAAFAACGIYQLTPLKDRCLAHCRSPLGHLLHYVSYRGTVRDLRAGLEHGSFCVACCWGLMVVLIAVGVMNVPAMIALAALIAVEKIWNTGQWTSRAIGAGALVAAVTVIWVPGLAPGLTNEPMDMAAMSMDAVGDPMGTGDMDKGTMESDAGASGGSMDGGMAR